MSDQGCTCTEGCVIRLGWLKQYEKVIEMYGEYLEFLDEAMTGPIGIAHIHGWSCTDADYDKGVEWRERIAESLAALPVEDE